MICPKMSPSGKRPCSCLHPHVSPWHPEAAGRAWAAPWDGGGQLWGAAQGPRGQGQRWEAGAGRAPPRPWAVGGLQWAEERRMEAQRAGSRC